MIENGRYDQIPKVNRFCPTRGYNRRWNLLNYSTSLNTQVLRFYRKKEYRLPNIKQWPPFQATKELMNTVNYHVNMI